MPLSPPNPTVRTTRPWDGIDRTALLRLSGRRETGTEFGYLLRHYGIPAMVLRYADTVRQRFPGGETVGFRHVFEQELRRCSADRCLWREKTLESVGDDGLVRFVRFRPEERLCEYDRSRQTWQTFSPLSVDHVSENVDKLADTAILCQNLMPPLLPIRPGFRWHVESKNGHMEFCFESVETVDDMTVLLIRRSGELILNEFYRFGVLHPQRYRIRREGLSAYSLEQSVVLEDRIRDIVEPAGRTTALENLETLIVRKLIQSRPAENRVAPLFLKHAVKRHRYVYDCGTGRILEVDSVIDTILDDFDILTEEEIQNKYDKMGREKVRTAIGELRILQHRGYMLGHPPTEPSRIDACVASLKKHGSQNSWETMPLAMLLFETQLEFFHRRNVTNFTPDRFYYIPCIPGFTRRFCDASGNYRVCERVDDSEAYRLGNVWDGLDAAKMKRTMELRRHHGDCGNCETLKFCDVCYARISRSDDTEAGFDPGFDSLCRKTRQSTTKMLQTYIEIMEANPQAFDKPDTGKMSRSDRLRFGSDETDRETETTERIKRETFDTQH